MRTHLDRELTGLRALLRSQAALARDELIAAARREGPDPTRPGDRKKAIRLARRDFEEECLKVLAMYHPSGADQQVVTRFIKASAEIAAVRDLACALDRQLRSLGIAPEAERGLSEAAATAGRLVCEAAEALAATGNASRQVLSQAMASADAAANGLCGCADLGADAGIHGAAGGLLREMVAHDLIRICERLVSLVPHAEPPPKG
jgi:phosphate uptake regulator